MKLILHHQPACANENTLLQTLQQEMEKVPTADCRHFAPLLRKLSEQLGLSLTAICGTNGITVHRLLSFVQHENMCESRFFQINN